MMKIASTRPAFAANKPATNSQEAPIVESRESWHVGDSVFASTDELLNVEESFNYQHSVYTWSETHQASRPPTLKERAVHSLKSSARTGAIGAITGTAAGAALALLTNIAGLSGGATVAVAAGGGALLGGAVGLYRGATTNPLHYTDSGSLSGRLSKNEDYASFSVDEVVDGYASFNLADDNISEQLKADDLQGTHSRVYHPL